MKKKVQDKNLKYEADKKLRECITKLLLVGSFWGYLFSRVYRFADNSIPTMGVSFSTTGKLLLGYNEQYVINVSDIVLSAILLHEAIHIINKHVLRGMDFIDINKAELLQERVWNFAADMAVNSVVPECKNLRYDIVPGVPVSSVTPSKFGLKDEKSAEYYMGKLLRNDKFMQKMVKEIYGCEKIKEWFDKNQDRLTRIGRGQFVLGPEKESEEDQDGKGQGQGNDGDGDQGNEGLQGQGNGKDGSDGQQQGQDGKDGSDGQQGQDGKDGNQGNEGQQGKGKGGQPQSGQSSGGSAGGGNGSGAESQANDGSGGGGSPSDFPCNTCEEKCNGKCNGMNSDGLLDDHSGWSTVYDIQKDDDGKITMTDVSDNKLARQNLKTAANAEITATVKDTVDHMMKNKSRGTIPGYLEQFIEDCLKPPKLPYYQIIKNFVQAARLSKPERCTTALNRKRTWMAVWARMGFPVPLPFPGRKRDRTFNICIAIDTSGSMSQDEIMEALSSCKNMIENDKYVFTTILECDTQVNKEYTVERIDDIQFNVSGRGGTTLAPALIRAKEIKADVTLLFTDGWCDQLNKMPREQFPRKIVFAIGEDNPDECLRGLGPIVRIPSD